MKHQSNIVNAELPLPFMWFLHMFFRLKLSDSSEDLGHDKKPPVVCWCHALWLATKIKFLHLILYLHYFTYFSIRCADLNLLCSTVCYEGPSRIWELSFGKWIYWLNWTTHNCLFNGTLTTSTAFGTYMFL